MNAHYRSIWLVMRREITERTRTRFFLISTLVLVAASAAAVVVAVKLPEMLEEGPQKVGTIGAVPDGFAAALDTVKTQTDVEIEAVPFDSAASADAALSEGKVSALLKNGKEIVFNKKVDDQLQLTLNQAVNLATLPQRLATLGVTAEQLQSVLQPAPLTTTLLNAPTEEQAAKPSDEAQVIAYAAVMLLLLAAGIYGNIVLNGVIEEKTSRVVEVLLGTLRPVDLLVGKVAGIMTVGLGQLAAAIVGGVAALIAVGTPANMPDTTFETLAVAVGAFLLGLTFFSLAYAAIGSTVAHPEDASNAPMPIAVFVGGIAILSTTLLTQPDSPVLRILSMVPPTSVFMMPQRVAIGDPSPFEIAAAAFLMLAAIWALARTAGRIYAGAILSGGKRVKLLSAWRSSGQTT
jgi:ABC-2 type transport system permease protein